MLKINFLSIIEKNIPHTLKLPHRSLIYVGYQCHLRCGFCYYKHHYAEPMFPKDYVLRQIDVELAYGITDFEITGGEPSECKDLALYCRYIKEKLPTAKIAVITNGSLYAFSEVWPYIDEVLVSYHISKNCKDIDKNMFPLGHTYEKVSKTMQLAKSLKKIVRTNTVVGTFNIDNLEMIADDLMSFKPDIVNFLPVNLFDDATDMGQFIDYFKLRPLLKKTIDRISNELPTCLICVRYMPFCDMQGYEHHILGTWQHMYDWFDWNPELCGTYLLDYLEKYNTTEDILKYLGPYGSRSLERSYDCIKVHYEKNDKCLKCKYYMICDGVEKIKNGSLLSQIVPNPGKIIKNPMEFIQDSIQKKYNELYS